MFSINYILNSELNNRHEKVETNIFYYISFNYLL